MSLAEQIIAALIAGALLLQYFLLRRANGRIAKLAVQVLEESTKSLDKELEALRKQRKEDEEKLDE